MASTSNTDRFEEFYKEVKDVEKKDSALTSKQQIDRLLRPGSTYFNLNPFEVLQLEPTVSVEEAKKQYKKLSLLLHPDKNPDDRERADKAFDIINKAYKLVENPDSLRAVKDIFEEGQARVDIAINEKKKLLRKQGKDVAVEEDDPQVYKRAVYVSTMKLFAEREKKRKQLEDRDQEQRKRQREEELAEEEKLKAEKEFNKNFEESREERASSWKNFQSNKKMKTTKTALKIPKHKVEHR